MAGEMSENKPKKSVFDTYTPENPELYREMGESLRDYLDTLGELVDVYPTDLAHLPLLHAKGVLKQRDSNSSGPADGCQLAGGEGRIGFAIDARKLGEVLSAAEKVYIAEGESPVYEELLQKLPNLKEAGELASKMNGREKAAIAYLSRLCLGIHDPESRNHAEKYQALEHMGGEKADLYFARSFGTVPSNFKATLGSVKDVINSLPAKKLRMANRWKEHEYGIDPEIVKRIVETFPSPDTFKELDPETALNLYFLAGLVPDQKALFEALYLATECRERLDSYVNDSMALLEDGGKLDLKKGVEKLMDDYRAIRKAEAEKAARKREEERKLQEKADTMEGLQAELAEASRNSGPVSRFLDWFLCRNEFYSKNPEDGLDDYLDKRTEFYRKKLGKPDSPEREVEE